MGIVKEGRGRRREVKGKGGGGVSGFHNLSSATMVNGGDVFRRENGAFFLLRSI